LKIYRLRTHEDYVLHTQRMGNQLSEYASIEESLTPTRIGEAFSVTGYSYPAMQAVKFVVDYQSSSNGVINWRERLVCPKTGLNNRIRASIHLADIELGLYPQDSIYLTEQTTQLYGFLQHKYPNLTGSEFLGDTTARGEMNAQGLRNEDLTDLSFPDSSQDAVLSFDCFEHIPDYLAVFRECFRILNSGGGLLWSVPFDRDADSNLVRATVEQDGTVTHLHEPEYHGDPVTGGGCICYYHFGWEMLQEAREAGFKDVYALLLWSKEFGYLGGEQMFFVAKK
jgi:SAM-dependent methyltransferase